MVTYCGRTFTTQCPNKHRDNSNILIGFGVFLASCARGIYTQREQYERSYGKIVVRGGCFPEMIFRTRKEGWLP
jgi:hypothetical protein